MKHIGFLSFGHWTQSPQSQTRSASDALLQSVELAVAAGELTKHASDHDERSRYREVGFSGPWRRCWRPGGAPSAVEASLCSRVLWQVGSVPGWHRGLRFISLLGTPASGIGTQCASDAARLCEALRQTTEER